MKKTYKLQDLECANCAAKIEDAVKDLDGVNDASVSFMTQKLSIDVVEDRLEEIMDKVERIVKKIEPDTVVVR